MGQGKERGGGGLLGTGGHVCACLDGTDFGDDGAKEVQVGVKVKDIHGNPFVDINISAGSKD